MSRGARRGLSLFEILVVSAIAMLVAIPLLGSISTSGLATMTTEDYMLAEALCRRHVQEVLALPWAELAPRLPLEVRLEGIPPGDLAIAAAYEEYARNLGGSASFSGHLAVKELQPGLLRIEVVLEWPVRPGSPAKRCYELVRLRARPDLSIRTSHALVRPDERTVTDR